MNNIMAVKNNITTQVLKKFLLGNPYSDQNKRVIESELREFPSEYKVGLAVGVELKAGPFFDLWNSYGTPANRHEEILAGFMGELEGVPVYSDAFLGETERFINPFEIWVFRL